MSEKWVLTRKGADFEAISKKYNISQALAVLIRNRNMIEDAQIRQFMYGSVADLASPFLMKDMEKAVGVISKALKAGERIRIIGDYDMDGVIATHILYKGLQSLNGNADYDIPDRIKDGYGLNRELIRRAADDGVDLIITCDNGIAASKEIAFAKECGIKSIITDHHEVPFQDLDGKRVYMLPPADAVINPKQPECTYPFKGLCGAAVAFKLMQALMEREQKKNPTEFVEQMLEMVAIATVGDVMDLVEENRILVKEGLKRLRNTSKAGVAALMQCCEIDREQIGVYDIGFVIGPCLNASGRLSTAKMALKLLNCESSDEALLQAEELKKLNDQRKEMTELALLKAVEQVEASDGRDRVLVQYLPECHESLAGIVAGRLKEKYHRPVFVLTKGENEVKGSGRSIEAYLMHEELNNCRDCLLKYGGHAMAAGLSLREENIQVFTRLLNDNCRLEEDELVEKVVIDMELPLSVVTEHFIHELELLEPFGKGNTKPVFASRNAYFTNYRLVGKNGDVLMGRIQDASGIPIDAVCFLNAKELCALLDKSKGKATVTFYPRLNCFHDLKTVQLIITHFKN